jgi:hypothetical protein
MNQPQVDEGLEWATRHWNTNMIVIEYLYSALFCPRIMSDPNIRKIMITQNREHQFYLAGSGLG